MADGHGMGGNIQYCNISNFHLKLIQCLFGNPTKIAKKKKEIELFMDKRFNEYAIISKFMGIE